MSTSSVGMQSLNGDAFLKLFVTQLKHQDPTSPMDPSAMLGQLAQLTTVQQLNSMSENFASTMQTERLSLARGLIGSEVEATVNDLPIAGVVESARIVNGEVGVVIGGNFVSLDAVQEIRAQSVVDTQGA